MSAYTFAYPLGCFGLECEPHLDPLFSVAAAVEPAVNCAAAGGSIATSSVVADEDVAWLACEPIVASEKEKMLSLN